MKIKKILCLLLCLTMLTGMLSGCGNQVSPESGSSTSLEESASVEKSSDARSNMDEETERAISYGIITEDNLNDTDRTITHKELCELITRMVALRSEDFVPAWKEVASLALQSDEIVHRDDAMLALFEAAIVMGTDHEFMGTLSDDWEGFLFTGDDWWEGASHNYPLFPNWEEPYRDQHDGNMDYGIFSHSAWYFENICSAVSYQRPFEPTDNYTYDFGREVSVDEAVRAVTRYTEAIAAILAPDPVYMPISETGAYDVTIITEELLNAPTDLPEVTQQELPPSWKGTGLTKRKDGLHTYRAFAEEDIAFLAENGFNFLRLFYGFETLRFPDYPQNSGVVNENELKDLDQLLAWCIKYGVHLQITMNRFFDEEGHTIFGQEGQGFEGMLPVSEAAWQVNADHWGMLAKRYAGIDSKYLTFDLINEEQPQDGEDQEVFDAAVTGMQMVVDAVRSQDSQRVLLISNPGNSNLEWNRAIAQMGVAIACHPYYPQNITTGHTGAGSGDYFEPCWPMPILPAWQISTQNAPLTLQGEIGGAELSVHVGKSGPNAYLEVFADGVLTETLAVPGGVPDENGECWYGEEMLITRLPDGTSEAQIYVRNEDAHIDTVIVDGSAGRTSIVFSSDEESDPYPIPVIICEDGSYGNVEGTVVTGEDIYNAAIEPLQRIAQEYHVGFMVSEFGIFADAEWDISIVAAHTDTMIRLLEEHSISWCFCELYNTDSHILIEFPGTNSSWANATLVNASPEGFDMKKQAVQELLDVFRKYTLK